MFSHTFVVIGATGWVGSSVMHALQQIIPAKNFNSQVLAFGSRSRTIISTGYNSENQISIPIYSLKSLPSLLPKHRSPRIIQAAFLTKDRINQIGLNSFIEINQNIINSVADALLVAEDAKVALISSGAAECFANAEQINTCLDKDPYGFLKLKEEKIVSSLAETQIFRIYALTGRFIRDPHSFALGNFLMRAKDHLPIEIKSSRHVIRGYGHANDIANGAIKWLTSSASRSKPINTISHELTLLDLASMITTMFSLPPVVENIDKLASPDIYTSKKETFSSFMAAHGLDITRLEDQIYDTSINFGLIRSK
jgi:nucleoside-diphosphate-sugar epimerase